MIYFISWILIIAVISTAALGIFEPFIYEENALPLYITGIGTILWLAIQGFVISSLGDAARHLNPIPKNIKLRRAIRANGIDLLRKIYDSKNPKYDRVILVGHSLGSVIAYDIMKELWYEYYDTYIHPIEHKQQALKDVEEAGEALRLDPKNEDKLEKFRECQIKLWEELRTLGNRWLITDFITMDSPLAHAAILMAKDLDDLRSQQEELRELPTCPPIADEPKMQNGIKKYGYSYERWDPYPTVGREARLRVMHYAACFAITRWTNLYFPSYMGIFGDIVGGPLRKWFGAGIRDIKLTLSKWRGLAKFTKKAHSSYWLIPKKRKGKIEGKEVEVIVKERALTELENVLNLYEFRKLIS